MPRNRTYENAAQAIGDTPMIRLNRIVPPEHATVFAKCEFFQPLNSVKDRIGTAMIEAGERDGKITPILALSSRPAAIQALLLLSCVLPKGTI